MRKCPYCDFNSHAVKGEVPEQQYLDALLRDLDFELSALPQSRPLSSIFMGGGTPSLFSGSGLGWLLAEVEKRLAFAPDVEITIEANPGTVDAAHFREYRAAGINRLSIGVQSLDARHLKALGRIHGPDEARRAVDVARKAGFENFNLDLMYALPNQTLDEAIEDLEQGLALAPQHLSWYQLTLEPNTEFAARPPPLPDAELAWAMQERGQELLAAAGFAQYEVSAYARPGRQCRHNLNYWEFGDYLGIGAGAHGKLSADGSIRRRARHKHPRTYLESAGSAAAVQEQQAIAQADLPFEYAMNVLRLNQGRPLAEFAARTGQPLALLDGPLAEARRRGWMGEDPERLQASARGRALLNQLVGLFLP